MKQVYFLLALCLAGSLSAQSHIDKMQSMDANFFEVQQEFEKYAAGKNPQDIPGFKPYKRWEHFWKTRVYPTGNFPDNTEMWNIVNEAQNQRTSAPQNTWSAVGPIMVPLKSNGQKRGIGRVNCVRFKPGTTSEIWVGSPGGGLWKSTNNGSTWTTVSDLFTNLGVSDIAFNPNYPDSMYLATGDGDAGDTYSYGILRSVDGGQTWTPTGLTFNINSKYRASRVLIDPTNTNYLIAATSVGIYVSSNAGVTWTRTFTTNLRDAEFHPTDPNIVYATSYDNSGGNAKMLRSSNKGVNWTTITAGLPTSGVVRAALAVTPANPDRVYALYANTSSAFKGLYTSTDKGVTWSLVSSTPNILANDEYGSSTSGQGWYDLALAVSPVDENLIFTGGVNIWKSTNGGASWTISAHWTGGSSGTIPYVHADQHALEFKPSGSVLYSGNDGGISYTTNAGSSWTDISDGLGITQFYRMGASAQSSRLLLAGAQDNGTLRSRGTSWGSVLNGDGMEAAINPLDSNNMYGELYYGAIYRTTNGGTSWSQVAGNNINGINETGDWVTPYVIDPNNPNNLYAGFGKVWKSTNKGSSWTSISNVISASYKITVLDVAKSNSNVIYAGTTANLYKTIDGGTTWTNISAGLPFSLAGLTYVAIDPANADHIYATFSGYSAANKVFESTNGGTNWTNISTGLPNLPVNCIVYQANTNDAVYVGTDVGVYYKNDTITGWQAYKSGLPNVIVNELEIHYATQKIRAATYGRGVWEAYVYDYGLVPTSQKELPAANLFSIYPNPAGDKVTVKASADMVVPFTVTIFNSIGQTVFENVVTDKSEFSIDLDQLPAGSYYVKVQNEKVEASKKLMILNR